ncbi:cupin domain-containing protein [Cobetia marina]|uniref:cupin domain-containing protein n=1 Tax=Cobetia TaxID=204286 RepID=UPI001596DD85|nr:MULTISPECIES: cupin domain-containing protein [Cobetia]MDH2372870.1 cupin domain-containing protein [Cobetia sp. 3AK]MDO6786765.1 cupin domain-containing protein [Cobetia marina]
MSTSPAPHDTDTPLALLGGLSIREFLRDYWQQKPLLIRGAFADFETPLEADELAGLACEDGIEARLVEENGPDKAWQVSHGPFDEATFARLDAKDDSQWSLLVQAVDHYVPDVAALFEPFTFLPRWRLDDIMISYAPTGGSVGPHLDNYDVFLLQAQGQRHWQLGGMHGDDAEIIDGIDLRILKHFEVTPGEDWVLEPGDMLYVPPRLAHHGVSQSDDCMTISVGFRAPSADEVVTSYADYLGASLPESLRYRDQGMAPVANAGELDDASLERVRELLLSTLDNPTQLAQWFGRYMTQPKYLEQLAAREPALKTHELVEYLEDEGVLVRSLGSRFAFRHGENDTSTLFVDGDGVPATPALAEALASSERLTAVLLDYTTADLDRKAVVSLLTALVNRGSLILECDLQDEEDEEEDDA